jgi:hypothetical protein
MVIWTLVLLSGHGSGKIPLAATQTTTVVTASACQAIKTRYGFAPPGFAVASVNGASIMRAYVTVECTPLK